MYHFPLHTWWTLEMWFFDVNFKCLHITCYNFVNKRPISMKSYHITDLYLVVMYLKYEGCIFWVVFVLNFFWGFFKKIFWRNFVTYFLPSLQANPINLYNLYKLIDLIDYGNISQLCKNVVEYLSFGNRILTLGWNINFGNLCLIPK